MRGIRIVCGDIVAEMHILEEVRIIFLMASRPLTGPELFTRTASSVKSEAKAEASLWCFYRTEVLAFDSRGPFSGRPHLLASRTYHVRGIIVNRDEVVA
jgi:hypothetical protein